MLDEQADSGSNSDDFQTLRQRQHHEEQDVCRELSRLEDLAQQASASALAKCAPVKNVEPDVCIDLTGKNK